MIAPRLAAVLLALCAFATAQSSSNDESEMSRVRRDQGRIAQRLQSLQEKMDRLAERYDAEGRQRNAQLLRDALERLDAEGLLERSRAVEQSLDAGLLATVEQQDELSASLEAIYALLRDRTDRQELAERVDLIKQTQAELGFLAEDELGLLQRTRGASDSPAELLDEALGVGAELQQNLENSQASTAELEAALRGLGESRQAAALAEAQRALTARASDPGADAVQRELSAALEGLRESLSQAAPQSAEGELAESLAAARERARELAAQAAEAMRLAEERLAEEQGAGRNASGEADSTSGSGEAGDGGEAAESGEPGDGASRAESGEAGASGAPHDGGETTEDGAPSDSGSAGETGESSAGGQQGESGESDASGQAGESGESGASGQAGESGESGASGQAGESGASDASKPAGESGEPGGGEEAAGSESADDSEGGSAEDAMESAAESLEAAAALLGESERALALQRNRARSQGLTASRQANAGAKQLEELMERLEAAEPDEGPELLDRTRELLDQVAQANNALEQGQSAGGAAMQSQAAKDLAALMQALQARRSGASESPPQPVDQAGREQLAAEQADVQRRLRELMDRLTELPDQGFNEALDRATEAMAQAEQALQEGRLDEAALRQQEAAEELKEAQEQLAQEEKRYDQLRQDEVLFRLQEELQSMLERQQAVSAETNDIEDVRSEAGRLGRSQRRALARLGGEQRDLALACAGVGEAISEDGAVAFVFALQRIVDDMNTVADHLEDESTGGLVRALQDGIERRFLDLLDVLEQERERRRTQTEESDEPPPEGEQPQPESPLVPPVAELLLLQRLELMALDRVERFAELFPEAAEGEELSPIEARELERWAIEHVRVTQLFESLIPTPAAPSDEDFQGLPPLPPSPLEPEQEESP
ncbi:MAG: hypothetical protein DHS20C15_10860 [Planctomycetota bacterium]|nr:MAG: hypothetical protein DHS20C15_10860 [Planctomycetota bacterium]